MSVLDLPPSQLGSTALDRPPVPVARDPVPPAVELPRPSGAGRWFVFLGIPFVLGALFFGLAIAFDAEWPLTPAFLFGPLLMIAAYIYLCLSSEANAEV
jgi:hypothetical protein